MKRAVGKSGAGAAHRAIEPLWGGCPGRPGHLSTGGLRWPLFGPVLYVAALARCPMVCWGTDDCGEHYPSTVALPYRRRPLGGGKRGI